MPSTNLANVLRILPRDQINIIIEAYLADRAPYMPYNAQNLIRKSMYGETMTETQKRQLKGYLERELEYYNRHLEPVVDRYLASKRSGKPDQTALRTMNAILNRVNQVGLRYKPGNLPHVNQARTLLKTRSGRR